MKSLFEARRERIQYGHIPQQPPSRPYVTTWTAAYIQENARSSFFNKVVPTFVTRRSLGARLWMQPPKCSAQKKGERAGISVPLVHHPNCSSLTHLWGVNLHGVCCCLLCFLPGCWTEVVQVQSRHTSTSVTARCRVGPCGGHGWDLWLWGHQAVIWLPRTCETKSLGQRVTVRMSSASTVCRELLEAQGSPEDPTPVPPAKLKGAQTCFADEQMGILGSISVFTCILLTLFHVRAWYIKRWHHTPVLWPHKSCLCLQRQSIRDILGTELAVSWSQTARRGFGCWV